MVVLFKNPGGTVFNRYKFKYLILLGLLVGTTTMARKRIMLENVLQGALVGLTAERIDEHGENTLTLHALPRWLDDVVYGASKLEWGGVKGLTAHTILLCLRRLPVISVESVQELLECSDKKASNYTRACRLVLEHVQCNEEAQAFVERYSMWEV